MKSTNTLNEGWAAWFTGLPGSGKSSVSKIACDMLSNCKRIEMDVIRKQLITHPKYTDAERDLVYEKLADIALEHVKNGQNVVIDATAHKLLYRENARKKIKRFAEVMVRCPIEMCIERESNRKQGLVAAQMYLRALERKEKGTYFEDLGKVIGVDVPYEENPDAEVIIDNDKQTLHENARLAANALAEYFKKNF